MINIQTGIKLQSVEIRSRQQNIKKSIDMDFKKWDFSCMIVVFLIFEEFNSNMKHQKGPFQGFANVRLSFKLFSPLMRFAEVFSCHGLFIEV